MNKVEQALVDSMEQVLLYLKMNDSNSEFTLGTDNLINWFKKLDSRLEKKYEEIGRENFLNIGNRNVEIYGEDFFSNKDELKKILIGIKDSHFSPGIKSYPQLCFGRWNIQRYSYRFSSFEVF